MSCATQLFLTFLSLLMLQRSFAKQPKEDPEELLPPVDARHAFPPRLDVPYPQIRVAPKIVSSKGDLGDLLTEETRHKKGRQSYSREYKPRRTNYNRQSRHSDGKKGNGGYHATDSYKGNSGYSSYSSYDKAKKDNHGDSDHKQYGNDGGKKGGGSGAGGHYGSQQDYSY